MSTEQGQSLERQENEKESWGRWVVELYNEGLLFDVNGGTSHNNGRFMDEKYQGYYSEIGSLNTEMVDQLEVLKRLIGSAAQNQEVKRYVAQSLIKLEDISQRKLGFLKDNADKIVKDGLAYDSDHAVNQFFLIHKEPLFMDYLDFYDEEISQEKKSMKKMSRGTFIRLAALALGGYGLFEATELQEQVTLREGHAKFIDTFFRENATGLSKFIIAFKPTIATVMKEFQKSGYTVDDRVSSEAEIMGLLMLSQMWDWPRNNFYTKGECLENFNFPEPSDYSPEEKARIARNIFDPTFYKAGLGVNLKPGDDTAYTYLTLALKYYTEFTDNIISPRNSEIIAYIADKVHELEPDIMQRDTSFMDRLRRWMRKRANTE